MSTNTHARSTVFGEDVAYTPQHEEAMIATLDTLTQDGALPEVDMVEVGARILESLAAKEMLR